MMVSIVAAISAGVMLIAISRRIQISAIVLLLLGGIVLGPEVLNVVKPSTFGDGLGLIVSLAVGLILFEGGLTLDIKGYRSASSVIKRLLSVGVLTTWFGTFLLIRLLFPEIRMADGLLAAALVIVTGPTVIAPLLKRIKIKENLHNILHWEGVLIDPLGVFIVIMCFEWIVWQSGGLALGRFTLRFVEGLGIGLLGGFGIYELFKRKLIPDDMLNVSALALAVLVFGVAEFFLAESGLLAITVAGLVLGAKRPIELKQLRSFKAEITDLMIGMLFILLAARLEFANFKEFGFRGALLVLGVMLLIRPLNVLCSTVGLGMNWRDQAFLSWVAPRGIVAASMASFLTIRLQGEYGGESTAPVFLETFTYSVIVSTVLIQGFTAGPLAALLKLRRPAPTGWMIIGAHPLGRSLAGFIRDSAGLPVLLIDSNAKAVREAQANGFTALNVDAREADVLESRIALQGIGNLIALTDNEDLNALLCNRWIDALGRDHVFRWNPVAHESEQDKASPGAIVWPRLPKPSLLSAELTRGEASLGTLVGPPPKGGNQITVLAMTDGKVLQLRHGKGDDALGGDKVRTLTLRREADYLLRSLRPELVTRLEVTNIDELFRHLVNLVVQLYPKVSREDTVAELLERERSFPTALGHGIAVPHAYCHALESRVCVVVQLPNGVDFHAPDDEVVKLAFLLLSPSGDPEGHLATMAEIARLVSDPGTRERLMAAGGALEILPIIQNFNPMQGSQAEAKGR
ncbi:MAG: hypothetical protein PWP23_3001 [Candidatus Sumerlaeota bacterium]|nr:hypothetical protein [Candidatus Sumerlaeota bacterium]